VAVVDHVNGGGVNFAAVGQGEAGDQALAMAQAFVALHEGFSTVLEGIRQAGAALRNAETALAGNELRQEAELNQLAVQRTRSVGQMVKSAISAVGNIVAGTLSAFPVTGGVLPNAAGSAQA